MRVSISAAAVFALTGCSLPSAEETFTEMGLAAGQRETAVALVRGYQRESMMPLRKRDFGRAACYARHVDMPAHLAQAHLAYLASYGEADRDYYGFFAKQGLSEQSAYEVFVRYETGMEKCSMRALMQN